MGALDFEKIFVYMGVDINPQINMAERGQGLQKLIEMQKNTAILSSPGAMLEELEKRYKLKNNGNASPQVDEFRTQLANATDKQLDKIKEQIREAYIASNNKLIAEYKNANNTQSVDLTDQLFDLGKRITNKTLTLNKKSVAAYNILARIYNG